MTRLVKIVSASDVPPNSMKTFEVEGINILLTNANGNYYAIGAICNHKQWDLSEGTLKGEEVECAGHGATWNLKTGEAKFHRALPPEPVYRIHVKDNDVFVELT